MATLKTHLPTEHHALPKADSKAQPSGRKAESVLDQGLRLLSSVRFGIFMLILLLSCCIVGMVIMQQNVEGFHKYYERLTPSQRGLYGSLGFFDIYHSWYFTLFLAVTGLNIILSSIERFPTAWRYIRKPKLNATPNFVHGQAFNAIEEVSGPPDGVAEQIAAAWRKRGLRPRISQEEGRTTIFAQRNVWNRLGAYFVHVALLTIFIGGFLTSRYGVGGNMEITPGSTSEGFNTFTSGIAGEREGRAQLPFKIECADLQQQLIRPEGGLDVMNTIDWLSFIKIKDGASEIPALVHLNAPYDYRGYRFFQSSFTPQGNARQITVTIEPTDGGQAQDVTIDRNGAVDVPAIGRVEYTRFYPDFVIENGKAATQSNDYNNPVAELRISTPDGKTRIELAFNAQMLSQLPEINPHGNAAPIDKAAEKAPKKTVLKSFEKVATAHTLTVQYDPGRMPVYAGFTLLALSLCGVFFFAHQRAWAVVEPDGRHSKVYFAGNTNRNRPAFEARFNVLVGSVSTGGAK